MLGNNQEVRNRKPRSEGEAQLIHQTPLWEEVGAMYDEAKEHIQEADYNKEMSLRKLKRSV